MGHKTYKFKVYENKRRNAFLHGRIEAFAPVYNHLLAVKRRYYSRYKKNVSKNRLQSHLTKLKKTKRFARWNELPSQALQDTLYRIEFGYDKFFRKENRRLPKFRSKFKYKSYTLTQAGYKFLDDNVVQLSFGIRGRIKRLFKFHKHRDFDVDSVQTVTIKRDGVGDLWLCITAKFDSRPKVIVKTGKTAGFDFGLKTYLTASDRTCHESPLFFKRNVRAVKRASRNLSRKVKGSKNRHRARVELARRHRKVAWARENFHWQLANELCKTYDTLCFETLNLSAMKRLWGRKVCDLGFADFLIKLQWVAHKHGKNLVQIDKFFPSSKTCNACGTVKEDLQLRDRVFKCACGWTCDRDLNAALNIHKVGKTTFAGETVRRSAA